MIERYGFAWYPMIVKDWSHWNRPIFIWFQKYYYSVSNPNNYQVLDDDPTWFKEDSIHKYIVHPGLLSIQL